VEVDLFRCARGPKNQVDGVSDASIVEKQNSETNYQVLALSRTSYTFLHVSTPSAQRYRWGAE
jgi:hypothetical protein